jgi:uncharacterized protein
MFARMSDFRKALFYFAIATALCAGAVFLTPLLGQRALNLAMFAPLVAVLVMMLVVTTDGRSREGWLRLGLHRAGKSGWGLALAVPPIVLGVAYGTVWLSGAASFAVPAGLSSVPLYVLDLIVSVVIVAVMGGIGEEIGWRDYLLPRLMGLGVRQALLVSGLLHGLFHLPAILWTPFYHGDGNLLIVVPLFLSTLTMAGVCYGYLRLTTGSVWPAAIAHSTFNIVWDRLNAFTQTSSPLTLEYLAGESGVLTLGALSIVALWLAHRLPARLAKISSASVPRG